LELAEILGRVQSSAALASEASVTCEATSVTVEQDEQIQSLKEIGITRLSIGCQTFDEQVLRYCNRTHTVAELRQTVQIARDKGMTTNIDLMLGLPGQTLEVLEGDLDALTSIEPDAVEIIRHEIVNRKMIAFFERHPELLVTDDDLFQMVLRAHGWIDERGYEQNGRFTSDAAFPFRYHWLHGMPILAFGARTRWYLGSLCMENHEDVTVYERLCDRGFLPVARHYTLPEREQMYRHLLLRLQLAAGLDRALFRDTFSADPEECFPEILSKLEQLGCIETDETSIRLTKTGKCFVEDICCLILDMALRAEYPELQRSSFSAGG
jgi:oxygen-independent coproporphyrinogen-3 oxidase